MTLLSLFYGTPWWVYVVFIYLMIVGYKYSQQRTVGFMQLSILPLIMTLWSALSFYKLFSIASIEALILWFIIFFGGIGIGYWIKSGVICSADHITQAITIPGSWSTLLLLSLLFVVKYYVGYACATATQECTSFVIQDMLFSTFIRSILLGNALYFFRAYHRA